MNSTKTYRISLQESGILLIRFILSISILLGKTIAQNVGIGTNNPQAMLHVTGTIMTPHIHSLNTAQIAARLAINSPVNNAYRLYVEGGNSFFGGNLNVANDGIIDNNFRINGRVGINGATNANYGLIVNNSNSYFQGNIITTGTATINGLVTAGANLSIDNTLSVANDAIVNGNLRTNGRAGIGGPTNGSYQLFVHSGNSYFQGNTIITGNASVQGDLSINGNGSVRSAGTSHLRVSFVTFNVDYNFHQTNHNHQFIAPITPFDGNANDVKVMIAQFIPAAGAAHADWFRVYMRLGPVSATNNDVIIRMDNKAPGANHIKGTLHLLVVMRDI